MYIYGKSLKIYKLFEKINDDTFDEVVLQIKEIINKIIENKNIDVMIDANLVIKYFSKLLIQNVLYTNAQIKIILSIGRQIKKAINELLTIEIAYCKINKFYIKQWSHKDAVKCKKDFTNCCKNDAVEIKQLFNCYRCKN